MRKRKFVHRIKSRTCSASVAVNGNMGRLAQNYSHKKISNERRSGAKP